MNTTNYYFSDIDLCLYFSGFDVSEKLLKRCEEQGVLKNIQEKLNDIETGKVVNITQNFEVDHYNLRMDEEKVKGKSLANSLALWEKVKKSVEDILETGHFKDVIFNGIGGSILGPLMVTIFVHGKEFYYNKEKAINLHFLSNTDPDSFTSILSHIDPPKTLLVTMSKSGGTAETMTNYFVFNSILREKYGLESIGANNMCITTKGSKLDRIGTDMKFCHIFHMNGFTGGRTSVGCAIGMVPAAFSGLDFSEFIKGQSAMDKLTRRFDKCGVENPALLISLAIQELTKKEGKRNMVVLGYNDSLLEFSHYLQQLYMESLGKKFTLDKVLVSEGQTVFGGVGTGEQHAFMQQIQNGVVDSFVRFIYFLKRDSDYKNEVCGSMGRQLLAFLKGTELSLNKNARPFFTTVFAKRDLRTLGMMVALEERIVSILAILKKVNAYDQPGVELGKKSAKSMVEVLKVLEKKISDELTEKQTFEMSAPAVNTGVEEMKEFPVEFIEAGLMDVYANVDVPNAYSLLRGKVSVKREYVDGTFVFKFKKI